MAPIAPRALVRYSDNNIGNVTGIHARTLYIMMRVQRVQFLPRAMADSKRRVWVYL